MPYTVPLTLTQYVLFYRVFARALAHVSPLSFCIIIYYYSGMELTSCGQTLIVINYLFLFITLVHFAYKYYVCKAQTYIKHTQQNAHSQHENGNRQSCWLFHGCYYFNFQCLFLFFVGSTMTAEKKNTELHRHRDIARFLFVCMKMHLICLS